MFTISISVKVGDDCNAIADYAEKLQAILKDRGILAAVEPSRGPGRPRNPIAPSGPLDATVTPEDGPLAKQYKMERAAAGSPINRIHCFRREGLNEEQSARRYLIRDFDYKPHICDMIATGQIPSETGQANPPAVSNQIFSDEDAL